MDIAQPDRRPRTQPEDDQGQQEKTAGRAVIQQVPGQEGHRDHDP